MIDLEYARKNYKEYLSKYDLSNDKAKLKVKHTYRVAEISRIIARAMNLNQEKQQLAELIGLLHDIGRFKQYEMLRNNEEVTKYDHGDYGAELLSHDIRKYIETSQYDNIIMKAIKNHNKFEIEENLSEEELFFSKLIRDADKIDILFECLNIFWKGKEELIEQSKLRDEICNSINKNQMIEIKGKREYNSINSMFTTLAYTFDINFKESYKYIKEQNYINKIIARFNFKDMETKQKVAELINILNTYIENKIKD